MSYSSRSSSQSSSGSSSSSTLGSEDEVDLMESSAAWRSSASRRARACMLAAIQTMSAQELDALLEPGQVHVVLGAESKFRTAKHQSIKAHKKEEYRDPAPKLQLERFACHEFKSRRQKRLIEKEKLHRIKGGIHPKSMQRLPQYQPLQAYHKVQNPVKPSNVIERDQAVTTTHKAYAVWRHAYGSEALNDLYGLHQPGVQASQRNRAGQSRLGGA